MNLTSVDNGREHSTVLELDALTVRFAPTGLPQVSNLKIRVGDESLAPWKTWFDSLTADPNGGETLKRQGKLEISDGNRVILTLGLKGLGVVRVSPRSLCPTCLNWIYHKEAPEVELFCEGMTIEVPPPPPPPPPAPTPQAKKDARSQFPKMQNRPPLGAKPDDATLKPAGSTADKGDREPEGMPRYPDCVRTSYTTSRTKVLVDETAEYTTKGDALAKADGFFTEEMKKLGWTLAYRQESGKDDVHTIDIRWEKEKNQARFVLGRTKDGPTTILVRLFTPIR